MKNLKQEIENDREIESKIFWLIDNKAFNQKQNIKLSKFLDNYYENKFSNLSEIETKEYFIERYSKEVWEENLQYADIEELIEYILG